MFGRAFGSAFRGARRLIGSRAVFPQRGRIAIARVGLAAVGAAATAITLASVVSADSDSKPAKAKADPSPSAVNGAKSNGPSMLRSDQFSPLTVVATEAVNENTVLVVVQGPEGSTLDVPTSSFVLVKAVVDGKEEVRPYTPTDWNAEKRALVFTVKVYPEGKVSKHMGSLKVGDTLDVKGPIQKLKFDDYKDKHVAFIAGGSGITPFVQILSEAARREHLDMKLTLVYANVRPEDIWMWELMELVRVTMPHFKTHYFLEQPPEGWTTMPDVAFGTHEGRVSAAALRGLLPPPGPDALVMVCGPPGMMKAVSGEKVDKGAQGPLSGALKDLGYTSDQVFKF